MKLDIRRSAVRGLAVAAPLACLLLAGCHVSTENNGKKDNVDIGTPFGSVHVKTDNSTDTAALGLALYPGAVLVKKDGKDGNSADVNLSFGGFHLGVEAAAFQTTDAPDKVLAFYRKDMARYGAVIECRGSHAVGQPTHTALGLTCDEQSHHHQLNVDGSDADLELRAGSEQHQHIVGVEPRDGGTRIGLVALELPSYLDNHDGKDAE